MCFGGLKSPQKTVILPAEIKQMEFTESLPICQQDSTLGNLLLSPSSHQIAISEFYAADRRIGSTAVEVLPAWSVRIVETDSLAVLREFHLRLPLDLAGSDQNSTDKNSSSSRNGKRQFVMTKSSLAGNNSKQGTSSNGTLTSHIGPSLIMKWSPDGRFLAAWPQDTSIIFILCPESFGSHTSDPLLRIQESSAVGLNNFKWTPDSLGLLVNLKYGMGIKYWRLDCKYPIHLFPYPKNVESEDGMVFSDDGKCLAILHRRDGVDHVAVYTRSSSNEDYKVFKVRNSN